MLARQPTTEDSSDTSSCRVDVRATSTPIGFSHLFLVYTNEHGNQYGYRAGPSLPAGFGDIELLAITDAHIPYRYFGPNRNTVVGHLLTECGIPRITPTEDPIGWDAQLYHSNTNEGGQEGAGAGGEGGGGEGGASSVTRT